MSHRVSSTVASGVFNFNGILNNLPSASRAPAFAKCTVCLFSTTSLQQSLPRRRVRRRVDPYREAQAKQRKAANVARQSGLRQERSAARGDPIRSRPTSFIESLRTSPTRETTDASYLNYFVKSEDLQGSLKYSEWLTEPITEENDPQKIEAAKKRYRSEHENASRALNSITSLENASHKDRTRINIQRCIDEFGRHNTDHILAPKPASTQLPAKITLDASDLGDSLADEVSQIEFPRRVGADTGSSEVQVAVLTAKINAMADNLGKKDKHNKRSLRLLVHKRQKLLSYLRRKERGGPRWQNLVEKLGIGDAMWKGEISL